VQKKDTKGRRLSARKIAVAVYDGEGKSEEARVVRTEERNKVEEALGPG